MRGGKNPADVLAAFRRELLAQFVPQCFGISIHGAKWGTQIMGDRVSEGVNLLRGLSEGGFAGLRTSGQLFLAPFEMRSIAKNLREFDHLPLLIAQWNKNAQTKK